MGTVFGKCVEIEWDSWLDNIDTPVEVLHGLLTVILCDTILTLSKVSHPMEKKIIYIIYVALRLGKPFKNKYCFASSTKGMCLSLYIILQLLLDMWKGMFRLHIRGME